MRDGLATPRYWWVQAKIIGIDGGYNSDPEYITNCFMVRILEH